VSTISIVMSSYKRAGLLKNTLDSIAMQTRKPNQIVVVEDGQDSATTDVCALARQAGLPVEFYERRNRPNLGYSNPAIPKNIGIKKSTGDILIIQCAEVMYTNPKDIENLVRPLSERKGVSTFATVSAREHDGSFKEWYAGPNRAPKWFLDFCQASFRSDVMAVGGFDEGFQGYGFDDDAFALRMQASGVRYEWALDVECHHQYHPIYDKNVQLSEAGRARFEKIKFEIETKGINKVANVGEDWGNIAS
jgi:glycosyltransferase involved in cell wall biosynthesis